MYSRGNECKMQNSRVFSPAAIKDHSDGVIIMPPLPSEYCVLPTFRPNSTAMKGNSFSCSWTELCRWAVQHALSYNGTSSECGLPMHLLSRVIWSNCRHAVVWRAILSRTATDMEPGVHALLQNIALISFCRASAAITEFDTTTRGAGDPARPATHRSDSHRNWSRCRPSYNTRGAYNTIIAPCCSEIATAASKRRQ